MEKALVGAFSVITNLRMELFQALVSRHQTPVTHREEVLAEGGVALEAAHGAVVAAEGVDDHLGLHLRLLGAAHDPALLRPDLDTRTLPRILSQF